MSYHETEDLVVLLPIAFMDRIEDITNQNFESVEGFLAILIGREMDLWDISDWHVVMKSWCSIALTIERLYMIDAGANPIPKDISASADRMRDLLKMTRTEPAVAIPTMWSGISFDPSIDETDEQLDIQAVGPDGLDATEE